MFELLAGREDGPATTDDECYSLLGARVGSMRPALARL